MANDDGDGGELVMSEVHDLQYKAIRFRDQILFDLEAGEVAEGYTYSHEFQRAESFMLAGNGPTVWAYFILDGDGSIDHAYLQYSEWESALAPIPNQHATALLKALREDS